MMIAALLALVVAGSIPGDSATLSYVANGITVIHRRSNTTTVVANLYLLGGVRLGSAAQAGAENLLLQVSERGTVRYSRAALRRAMARSGSDVVIEPREDWTLVGLRTTPTELDSAWSIFADRIVRPKLDSTDVEFVRGQMLAAIRQREDSPDALLEYLSDSVAFAGHAYERSPVGTATTLAAITRADLKRLHTEQFVKSRMLLVIVGNVDRPTVERLVATTLGALPEGSYRWTMPDTAQGGRSEPSITRRALPTNYLQGYFLGPPANSPDAPALRVASAVLSGRLFGEIRSKRNLTYAVSANFRDRAVTSVGLYVTTTQPDSVLTLMRTEIRSLMVFPIETQFLQPIVQQFITEYFLDNETSTAQADFLARAQLYRGDWAAGSKFVSELRSVTGTDVMRVAQRYLVGARWAYVGDPLRLSRTRLGLF